LAQADGDSVHPAVSDDGSVAFASTADNLVQDTEGFTDVFVHGSAGVYTITPGLSPTTGLDFGNQFLLAAVSGQKFDDLNGNGVHDPGEPGLNGWTVELVNRHTDQVVARQVTADVDLDGDGVIDPERERGIYRFDPVEPDNYEVREVLQDGWRQTFPS